METQVIASPVETVAINASIPLQSIRTCEGNKKFKLLYSILKFKIFMRLKFGCKF